jgi:hypothetical protein
LEDNITPGITIAMGYDTEANIDPTEIDCRGIYLFILLLFYSSFVYHRFA